MNLRRPILATLCCAGLATAWIRHLHDNMSFQRAVDPQAMPASSSVSHLSATPAPDVVEARAPFNPMLFSVAVRGSGPVVVSVPQASPTIRLVGIASMEDAKVAVIELNGRDIVRLRAGETFSQWRMIRIELKSVLVKGPNGESRLDIDSPSRIER